MAVGTPGRISIVITPGLCLNARRVIDAPRAAARPPGSLFECLGRARARGYLEGRKSLYADEVGQYSFLYLSGLPTINNIDGFTLIAVGVFVEINVACRQDRQERPKIRQQPDRIVMSRLEIAIARIDAANGEDPNCISIEGAKQPAELVYGQRMSEALDRLYPHASELLQIAVRAQHIRRWTVPRSGFPMDRTGYLKWRTDMKARHAKWAGEILTTCGYTADEVARVGSLIRKERMKQDDEAQALEDVASIVFLENYFGDFAFKHEEEKVVSILKKTLAKMSARGRKAVNDISFSPPIQELISKAT
jgi:Domain of unknown function (DUF4202)